MKLRSSMPRPGSIKTLLAATSLALGSTVLPVAAQAQSGLTDLGTPSWSSASGVSADGSVVVGEFTTAAGPQRAFRWTQLGGMVSLGTLPGGTESLARGVSADGSVVVGGANIGVIGQWSAFRWTQAGGMVDLGTLGGPSSRAYGVSADGSVVVGWANTTIIGQRSAFRWTQLDGMVNLGTLPGNPPWMGSHAYGVSADGSVVVGSAFDIVGGHWRAFRWTHIDGMVSLGTLPGGTLSEAYGVSADGSVVVGESTTAAAGPRRAFRWTQLGGMVSLGTLPGGTWSRARGVSADGSVVVGESTTAAGPRRAFRWTGAVGMQSVEDWLRAAGVSVPADITRVAYATNSDGSVVVGELATGRAFIARVVPIGIGLVTLQDVQASLGGTALGGSLALTASATVLNGAHSRPLARRVAVGQNAFWVAGDLGRDDHGTRDGSLGLTEVGLGRNFGAAQINVSLGHTWARQNLVHQGRARVDGTYLLAQALLPVAGNLWAVAGGYVHRGEAELRRGYLNAGAQDYSTGRPDADTWGLRARLEWDRAWQAAGAAVSPYVDLTYSEARLAAYTETGGGFPVRFDARRERATELRLGVHAARPMADGVTLLGIVEAVHRFERQGARTSGEVIGLFGFNLDGQRNQRDWLRAGIGMEGRVAGGMASVMLNATTRGETLSYWLMAGWQRAF
jgi:probable HAF family extracellular repeat protein